MSSSLSPRYVVDDAHADAFGAGDAFVDDTRGRFWCSFVAAAATVPLALAGLGPDWIQIPLVVFAAVSALALIASAVERFGLRRHLPRASGPRLTRWRERVIVNDATLEAHDAAQRA